MPFLTAFLILALGGASFVKAVTYNLKVANKHIAPDGYSRSAVLVNDMFPGPILTATKGDCLTVKVDNQLTDPSMRRSTTINWHGIQQIRDAQNDGAAGVTQCPIAPGYSYTYQVNSGDQAGTFWYHSHLSTQYVDGLRGALIIYDPKDPMRHLYDVDDKSTVITLADWFHNTSEKELENWHSTANEPVPDSGLINGIGRYSSGPQTPRARINVVHGKRYRFRLICASVQSAFEVAISNHSMTVIEADGVTHKPYVVDSILIAPGQRYSVVVNANQSVENYWFRAIQLVRGNTTSPDNPNLNGANNLAVLHYAGAPDAEPTAPQPKGPTPGDIIFEEYKLSPLENPGSPGGANPPDLFVFTFDFAPSINALVWLVNGVNYEPPAGDNTLLEILSKGYTQSAQFHFHNNVVVLPANATIEIVFPGGGPQGGHPIHLHGNTFDVVQSATGPSNYVNPPRRDVVVIGEAGTRIRFKARNGGPWLLHCHIDWHLYAGLAAVMVVDPKGIQEGPKSLHPNHQWEKLCSVYNKLDPSLQ